MDFVFLKVGLLIAQVGFDLHVKLRLLWPQFLSGGVHGVLHQALLYGVFGGWSEVFVLARLALSS